MAAFDIRRVNANPARFDAKKCEAINASHIRLLAPDDLATRLVPFLVGAGLVSDPPLPDEELLIAAATPLVQERINTLSEAVDLMGFLFLADDRIEIDPAAGLTPDSATTLAAAAQALESVTEFTHPQIEAALRAALIDGLGLKPRLAFGPVRAAVTGRRISPPLFESLELIGRESALARLAAAAAALEG